MSTCWGPPLGLPGEDPGADPLAEVLESEAAALFVARARAHDDHFVLDDSSARWSPRSAGASTGCRWPSSWPPPGCEP